MIHNVFLITPSGNPLFTVKLGSIETSEAMVRQPLTLLPSLIAVTLTIIVVFFFPDISHLNGVEVFPAHITFTPIFVRATIRILTFVILLIALTGWLDRFLDREKTKTKPATA